jgi:type I restriction enzyme S subunit
MQQIFSQEIRFNAQIRAAGNPKFIYQYLHYQRFVDIVIERCTGTSYPSINSTDLSNIAISNPCFRGQTRIANFLSSLDIKINNCTDQISNLEQWKKGLLQRKFC